MNNPKCTIFQNWTGPECGKPAVSMNDYGGFQCEFHSSLPKCTDNKPGPFKEIDESAPNELQIAYDDYLNRKAAGAVKSSYKTSNRVTMAAHNVPQNMERS